jgi:hypothetical protein
MAVFWVVVLCSLVEVSEVLAASIIRAIALMIGASSTTHYTAQQIRR